MPRAKAAVPAAAAGHRCSAVSSISALGGPKHLTDWRQKGGIRIARTPTNHGFDLPDSNTRGKLALRGHFILCQSLQQTQSAAVVGEETTSIDTASPFSTACHPMPAVRQGSPGNTLDAEYRRNT